VKEGSNIRRLGMVSSYIQWGYWLKSAIRGPQKALNSKACESFHEPLLLSFEMAPAVALDFDQG